MSAKSKRPVLTQMTAPRLHYLTPKSFVGARLNVPTFALPFPAIDPVAIELGPFTVRWYALAYVVGLLGGWAYAYVLVRSNSL